MKKQLVRLSKFISLVLRHKPESAGLSLDDAGWVSVDDLLSAASRSGRPMNMKLLAEVVETNDKQRFSFNADKTKIRANQGHSINVNLGLDAITPPEILFHGTATRFLPSISQKGLISKNRQHVHLSSDEKTAVKVGQRHGKPVVLTIRSQAMHKANFVFYLSENGVWLTDKVPAEYIVGI